RASFFPAVSAYVAAVPTYVGGFMTLGIAAKGDGLRDARNVEIVRERAERAGLLGATRYWTPSIHVGAFDLPPYIAEHLPRR
ncbi:MAG: polyamine aminopropyltransferase, partial [Gluconacetobacter diazotrophicus]|nr:polyamine aminopropyltransferase [Gluconacetobacter diazotrophicus]